MKQELPEGKCPVCGEELEPPKTVWCRDCQTPHHRDCFAYAGKCATYGCGCLRFNKGPGKAPGTTWIEIKDDAGNHVPQGYVLDFMSDRESFYTWMAVSGLFVMFFACFGGKGYHGQIPFSPIGTMVGAVWFALGGLLAWGTDDYRVLDSKTRQIWLHRRSLGFVSNTPEIKFTDCRKIVVSTYDIKDEKGKKREFYVFLELRDGSTLKLMNPQSVARGFDDQYRMPESMTETLDKLQGILQLPVHVEKEFRGDTQR